MLNVPILKYNTSVAIFEVRIVISTDPLTKIACLGLFIHTSTIYENGGAKFRMSLFQNKLASIQCIAHLHWQQSFALMA